MPEKRRLPRRHLIYYLRVYDRDTVNLMGHLVDITQDGVMLVSEKPIEAGLTFKMRMVLPKEIFGRDQMIFEAVSRWKARDANPNLYDTGFQFTQVSEDSHLIINRLIEEFGFKD